LGQIEDHYKALKGIAEQSGLGSKQIATQIARISALSIEFASTNLALEEVTSSVPGKRYGVFRSAAKRTRPVNLDLFDSALLQSFLGTKSLADIPTLDFEERRRVIYSLAMSFCIANDIIKSNDQKSPGTFFEYFIGHFFAAAYGLEPRKHIQVLNLDADSKLPTDYIFDLGPDKSKIHLPIKLSTRERVVQVWAHQRVLDGVFGTERFKGVLVSLAETNFQGKNNSVVEVCLPNQWAVYQMFIARLFRVYYLDLPEKYRSLSKQYPFINAREFAMFFDEAEKIVAPPDQE
jgi:hypothetical protein